MRSFTVRAWTKFVLFAAVLGLAVPALRAQGDSATIYKSKCAMCHAPDGSGNSPTGKAMKVPDLRGDVVQKLTDAELTDVITKGKAAMPKYQDKLKADEIKGLVAYVRSLAKK